MSHLPPNGRPFGNGNGTNGIKFDYSRINEITATMKEKLKKKYETSAQLSSDATSNANSDTPSDVSVLDSYITDIENLFLSGVYNGDLRVSGKIYADSIESANGTNGNNGNGLGSHSDSDERGRRLTKRELQEMVSAVSDGLTWIRQEMKHAKIEDSRLVRCQFFHPDFVNEVRFRDNVNCEQKMRIGGIQDTNTAYALEVQGDTRVLGNTVINGNLTVDTNVLVVDASNNRVGIGRTNPVYPLDISGDTNTSGKLRESGNSLIPRGVIVAWFGSVASVPAGWALCNGQNGTPDLRGRFILGINPSTDTNVSLSQRELSQTGGAETHTLTINEMPAHSHTYTYDGWGGGSQWSHGPDAQGWNRSFPNTSVTGGNQPHNNMPPFFVLAYIMKL